MKRNILADLKQWKASDNRKPLVLQGARQVGKTTVLKRFGEEAFSQTVYLNFERDKALADLFALSLAPDEILQKLSIYKNCRIEPDNTLLIFDEIQECPRALNSLKYFCEEAREYYIASAGSLLGVKTIHTEGFPVGKVNFLHMYPLTFFEFLTANGQQNLREFLENYISFSPIIEVFHNQLIEQLKYYFAIGGMPEAIATYLQNKDLNEVREVHHEILAAYQNDFAKHAPANQIMKVTTIWEQTYQQLAKENKKFIFSAIKQSARGRDYEEAIQWLLDAGLIYKSFNITIPKMPLSAYRNNAAFKIFMLDVGLFATQSQLSFQSILQGHELFQEFKEALTENFVAQEFISHNRSGLYYWNSENKAELAFICQYENNIFPLEVKSGKVSKQKSLLSYANKYPGAVLSRATLMNLKHDGAIFNYPLYLVSRFPELFKITIQNNSN